MAYERDRLPEGLRVVWDAELLDGAREAELSALSAIRREAVERLALVLDIPAELLGLEDGR